MLTAITRVGFQALARDVERDDGPFVCPGCSEPVVIKKGLQKAHHFAHVSDACSYGLGESDEHHSAKLGIYDWLWTQDDVEDVCVERAFGSIRPDVSFILHGQRVGIEVQRSSLTLEGIQEKAESYAQYNMRIMWVFLPSSFQDRHNTWKRAVRVASWILWVHSTTKGGMILIWWGDAIHLYKLYPYARGLSTYRLIHYVGELNHVRHI